MTPHQRAAIRHLTDGLTTELHAWRRPADGDAAGQPQLEAVMAIASEGLAKARARGTSLASDDHARRAIALFPVGSALLDQPTEPR